MKVVVAAFNQEKVLNPKFSMIAITFQALVDTTIATHIGGGSQPEGGIFPNISGLQKSCFQPVVQS